MIPPSRLMHMAAHSMRPQPNPAARPSGKTPRAARGLLSRRRATGWPRATFPRPVQR
jgi:hypothetical protein